MIEINNKCTGCGACFNVCPQRAISMKENSEGFLFPEIDYSKCTRCGLCEKVCLLNNQISDNFQIPKCYAAASDDCLRKKSSSGGIFPLLAEEILSEGGLVCGAAFDTENKVSHILISDLKDLDKLKGAKYLQSETKDVFSQIKIALEKGKKILFSGTPCQVAGFNLFLRKKYDNLITIDLICHGTPSPKVYKKYLKELKKSTDEKILSTDFRDKLYGWENFSITHSSDKTNYSNRATKDSYYRAFVSNLTLRKSCNNCPVIGFARHGDITLGDFWGINSYDKKLNDHLGTSCVLLNSLKGKEFFEKIQSKLKIYKEVPLKYATKGNPSLIHPSVEHPNRNEFFENLDNYSLKKNFDYCLDNKCDCAILNFWYSNNYGAILTCWALQEKIKEFNLKPKIIQWIPYEKNKNTNLSESFSKFLNLTTPCYSITDLKKLNDLTDTFIVGSDQVWRYIFAKGEGLETFWLNFAKSRTNKIAYACSFGSSEWEGTVEDTEKIKYYMSRFNSISVREDDGVDMCQNIFDVSATHVLDPVFLIDPSKYDLLAKESKITDKKIIASYLFQENKTIEKSIELMKKKYPNHKYIPIKDVQRCKTDFFVSDFLYTIKNCDFFITDSFHGVCFAIIYNKPFICFANVGRGFSRFKSLFNIFGLNSRCILHEENNLEPFFEKINYEVINSILKNEKEKSCMWLLNALKNPQKNKNQEIDIRLEYLKDEFDRTVESLIQYPNLKKKYLKYKLLSFFTFGKTKKKFRQKRKLYKQKLKDVKNTLFKQPVE